jgi:hypothetical protein
VITAVPSKTFVAASTEEMVRLGGCVPGEGKFRLFRADYGTILRAAEWSFTILFTAEYLLRLMCVRRPAAYAVSFFGIVDLLAIVPTYLSLFIAGTQSLIVIRALRLLRVSAPCSRPPVP